MSHIQSVFKRLRRSLALKTSLSLLLIMTFFIPNSFNAYADTPCNSSVTNLQDSNYRGPVFLDSYWTDQSVSSTSSTGSIIKKEVGPGEGPSSLAVVLVNRSPDDLINVQGVLNLPSGLVVAGTSGDPSTQNIFNTILRTGATNPAVASYGATVPAGSTFTMYFDINVLKNAKVGLNPTPLVINYYTTNSFQSCYSALLTVPFIIPGKVILDAVTDTANIIPNQQNTLSISLINKGSADATGVVATILSLGETNTRNGGGSSGSVVLQSATTQLVNLGSNSFNVGTIPANGKATISTIVFPSGSSSGTTQNVQLQLSYGNAYGYKLTSTFLTGLVVSPDNSTTTLNVSYQDKNSSPILTAGKLDDLNFTVSNNSTSRLSNIVISLTPPTSALSVVGDSKWTIQSMEPGASQELSTKVFAATSMIDTPASFSLNANYVTNGMAKTDTLNLGTYVIGDINVKANDISVNYIGDQANIVGDLLNQGSSTGLFTSIQLLHPEMLVNRTLFNGSGNNHFTGDSQGQNNPGFNQFNNNPQGENSNGNNRFANGQGGTQFQGRGNSSNYGPVYIGDLTANSPTPFSIPLSGTISRGVHQVSFKVVYADDLKHFHEVILNGTLISQPQFQSNSQRQGSSGFGVGGMFLYLPITGASVAAATFFVMRKRNFSKNLNQKNNKDIDIESLLDDSSKEKK